MKIERETLLDCSVCKQSKDHEKMYNVACFDKDQIQDCELQNIIRNNPQIMKDDNLICFDCLDNKDNHKQ
mgnify:FL=1|tara:strand:+ start:312 stop:521 length:210 start_codon:yes stop_codon:yes gene_type:complete